ncbi:hypothetical protein GCM10017788_08770 [Amycolatopsis acidiphila]|nr:hypothetical protein GCM10017788_08770 [Amycolatopsis acidiphila]
MFCTPRPIEVAIGTRSSMPMSKTPAATVAAEEEVGLVVVIGDSRVGRSAGAGSRLAVGGRLGVGFGTAAVTGADSAR